MARILRNTQATLSVTFEVDGVPTDPSPATATVTITRDDGTAIVTNAAATHGSTGVFSYTLAAVDNDQLDVLTAAWTSSLGTLTTQVEVVGGFLFTISEARALKPLDNTTTYTAQQIIDTRTLVEQALEDACGVAFVPRYRRELVNGSGSLLLMLDAPRITAIRSSTLDGVATTDSATIIPSPTGMLYYATGWTLGTGNYEIAYEHGYAYPPERVKNAALRLAKRWLVDSPVSDRATSLTTEDGTTQMLVTAGVRQAVFDVPEANAVVEQYSMRAGLA